MKKEVGNFQKFSASEGGKLGGPLDERVTQSVNSDVKKKGGVVEKRWVGK